MSDERFMFMMWIRMRTFVAAWAARVRANGGEPVICEACAVLGPVGRDTAIWICDCGHINPGPKAGGTVADAIAKAIAEADAECDDPNCPRHGPRNRARAAEGVYGPN